MTDNKKQFFGMAAALAANLIFGFSFVFSKMALEVAHPLIILSVRFTVAFIAMNILVLLGGVKVNFRGKKKGRLLLMCIAQPLLYFVFELYGLSLTSSALSGIIISLVPVGVIILSTVFLKEKPTALQVVCTIVSIVGVSVVSLLSNDGSINHIIGVILLILTFISAAVFNILSRSESAIFSPFERTYFMFLVGFIGFNVISAITLRGEYLSGLATAICDIRFIVAIIYLAVLSSVVAFLLYNYSTTVISAVRSSSFSNIITVVSVLAGAFILKENFSWLQLLLCIPIIAGVWGVNYNKEK